MTAHEQSAEQAEEVAGVGRLRHHRPTEEEPGRGPASNIQVLGGYLDIFYHKIYCAKSISKR